MHASLRRHSELLIHSGWQFGGDPTKPRWHEQEGESPIYLHIEWGPHGDGVQGSIVAIGVSTEKKHIILNIYIHLSCPYIIVTYSIYLRSLI